MNPNSPTFQLNSVILVIKGGNGILHSADTGGKRITALESHMELHIIGCNTSQRRNGELWIVFERVTGSTSRMLMKVYSLDEAFLSRPLPKKESKAGQDPFFNSAINRGELVY
ncbi:hypothetical protein CTI12_AA269150 [Artemisia annua]|uniref:Uncharacterized protein n=1 Tax=Artemisia annua TaxID=35608 RepID=A0A2U1NG80_ARTAN|nr:hypothetical protein CTI12_AA269150 [Artemisia annua]